MWEMLSENNNNNAIEYINSFCDIFQVFLVNILIVIEICGEKINLKGV